MHIGLDARITAYNNSGISRYCRGLLSGFEEIQAGDQASGSDVELTLLLSKRRRRLSKFPQRFRARYLHTPPHNRFERFLLPFELRRFRCTAYHAMDFFMPGPPEVPQILSVYDLYFLKDPRVLDAGSFRHYARLLEHAHSARHIICCSEATKRDLLELSGVRPERVTVIYPGPPKLSPALNGDRVLRKHGLSERFILFVGTIEPRKNIERLLLAYRRVRDILGDTAPMLVLAGRRGFRSGEILSGIQSLNLASSVLHLGEISDSELASLYSAATVMVYPSLYEGFGFPLLEAMGAGVPILSSNTSSIPEVVGDAALLVEPESVESISDGMLRLAQESELRSSYATRGRERLSVFSWAEAARKTVDIYREISEPR